MKKNLVILMAVAMISACGGKGGNSSGPNESHLQPFATTFDFGTIEDGAPLQYHDFQFRNDGKDPLVITKVETYCHCTAVKYPKEPIKPGEVGVINLCFDSSDATPGFFSRDIDVYYNGKDSPVRLTISGEKERMKE